jgi:deferrochelatase/peroxidase EfeB
VTPPLPYLSIAGFNAVGPDRAGLAALFRVWTDVAATLTAGPARLTVTFGVGPSMFAEGRFGLADQRPEPLAPLPAFPGEAIDRGASDGDVCIQVCADSPTAAHQAIRALVNAGRPGAALRWRQTGFRAEDPTDDPPGMFGFRDGTANLNIHDPAETAAHLWVSAGPDWLHGGTYLVVRRIRLLLDTWDRTDIAAQEAIIGRELISNRRIVSQPNGHANLASPESNSGAKLLRRSYAYDAGADPNGLLDSGLVFICFQRDPQRQFVPIQQRLASHDALNGFSQHLASGVFACPPGALEGSFVGAGLLS